MLYYAGLNSILIDCDCDSFLACYESRKIRRIREEACFEENNASLRRRVEFALRREGIVVE